MAIQSRTIVGGVAALAIVGVGVWMSTVAMAPPEHRATVEVQQLQDERSWAVEIKELDAAEKTASR